MEDVNRSPRLSQRFPGWLLKQLDLYVFLPSPSAADEAFLLREIQRFYSQRTRRDKENAERGLQWDRFGRAVDLQIPDDWAQKVETQVISAVPAQKLPGELADWREIRVGRIEMKTNS